MKGKDRRKRKKRAMGRLRVAGHKKEKSRGRDKLRTVFEKGKRKKQQRALNKKTTERSEKGGKWAPSAGRETSTFARG